MILFYFYHRTFREPRTIPAVTIEGSSYLGHQKPEISLGRYSASLAAVLHLGLRFWGLQRIAHVKKEYSMNLKLTVNHELEHRLGFFFNSRLPMKSCRRNRGTLMRVCHECWVRTPRFGERDTTKTQLV